MRIAYVLRKFCKYSETFIAHEIAELIRRGHEVRVFTPTLLADPPIHPVVRENRLLECTLFFGGDERDHPATGALSPELRRRLRRLAEAPPPGVRREEEFVRLVRLTAAVEAFAPDHVHAHFATEGTHYARALRRVFGLPFTFTAHRYDIYSHKAPVDFADRAAAAAAVITVSEANARYIVETFGVPAARIHVIPCGVDTERFRPQQRRTEPPHIVCVARLVPFKNLGLLLEACAALRARRVEFRCVLVGDGSCRDELNTMRGRLGLERVVELVGAAEQTEVLTWWQRAAIAVLTSGSEGMPVCLMEAAACGVPAVATAVGGVPEVVGNGVTGLLVDPGDAADLADALERLLSRPDLCRAMGRAARERAEALFGLERQVDRLLELWSHSENPVSLS